MFLTGETISEKDYNYLYGLFDTPYNNSTNCTLAIYLSMPYYTGVWEQTNDGKKSANGIHHPQLLRESKSCAMVYVDPKKGTPVRTITIIELVIVYEW